MNPDKATLERNIVNMKRSLYEKGPFYCAMTVYDDFFTYTGTYPYKPNKNASFVGGHAIQVIGYHEDEYWICRNSWGVQWPLRTKTTGYFTIVMGSNICGIESRCGYAVPSVYGPSYTSSSIPLEQLRIIEY